MAENIINVDEVIDKLKKIAARFRGQEQHKTIERWLKTVAKNYLIESLPRMRVFSIPSEKSARAEFFRLMALYLGAEPGSEIEEKNIAGALLRLKKNPIHLFEQAQLPEWYVKAVVKGDNIVYLYLHPPAFDDASHICDYLAAEGHKYRDVTKLAFTTAKTKAQYWIERINAKIAEENDGKTVVEICQLGDNEHRLVQLVKESHFKREGKLMKHCLSGGTYFRKFEKGGFVYFSVRDASNNPKITIEAKVQAVLLGANRSAVLTAVQVAGPENRMPQESQVLLALLDAQNVFENRLNSFKDGNFDEQEEEEQEEEEQEQEDEDEDEQEEISDDEIDDEDNYHIARNAEADSDLAAMEELRKQVEEEQNRQKRTKRPVRREEDDDWE